MIGSSGKPVFTITNQSDVEVVVALRDVEPSGFIILCGDGLPVLNPGETASFYFKVNTHGVSVGNLSAQLQVNQAGE